ncbi:MAG: ligase-associated DNA damage response endonuclease PdeM [Bacteroidota bacterium]|nr:ligase-associated DNA damage response endonuclease PdeM [Bacteroidota bacterium]
MQAPASYNFRDQHFWLSPGRVIYWEEQQALIASDLHLGKTGHFRKSGIAVPQEVFKEDMQCLADLISFFNPKQLLVVGDFFHSHANKELEWFMRWRNDFSILDIQLIKGNHDILHDNWYQNTGIRVIEESLTIADFTFIHSIEQTGNIQGNTTYFFSGHIHPGVTIKGIGKQSLRFPCFYFGENYAVLPAFSRFTGLASIKPQKKDIVFAIVNNTVIQVA